MKIQGVSVDQIGKFFNINISGRDPSQSLDELDEQIHKLQNYNKDSLDDELKKLKSRLRNPP